MHKQRPFGITLFVVWAVIMGGLVLYYGFSYFKEGMDGINSAATDIDPQLIQSWFPYFRAYMWAGAIWMLGGLGYLAGSLGIWNAEGWGRRLALYAGGTIVLGWAIIQWVSASFKNAPPLISLFVGLIAVYLLTTEAREYCEA
jgi:hypothetical protein